MKSVKKEHMTNSALQRDTQKLLLAQIAENRAAKQSQRKMTEKVNGMSETIDKLHHALDRADHEHLRVAREEHRSTDGPEKEGQVTDGRNKETGKGRFGDGLGSLGTIQEILIDGVGDQF